MSTIDDTVQHIEAPKEIEETSPKVFKRTSWTGQKAVALRAALEVGASIKLACSAAGISNKT